MTISELIRLCDSVSADNPDFLYLREASSFLQRLGNKQIRNVSLPARVHSGTNYDTQTVTVVLLYCRWEAGPVI